MDDGIGNLDRKFARDTTLDHAKETPGDKTLEDPSSMATVTFRRLYSVTAVVSMVMPEDGQSMAQKSATTKEIKKMLKLIKQSNESCCPVSPFSCQSTTPDVFGYKTLLRQ